MDIQLIKFLCDLAITIFVIGYLVFNIKMLTNGSITNTLDSFPLNFLCGLGFGISSVLTIMQLVVMVGYFL